jgi:hypothetical protein
MQPNWILERISDKRRRAGHAWPLHYQHPSAAVAPARRACLPLSPRRASLGPSAPSPATPSPPLLPLAISCLLLLLLASQAWRRRGRSALLGGCCRRRRRPRWRCRSRCWCAATCWRPPSRPALLPLLGSCLHAPAKSTLSPAHAAATFRTPTAAVAGTAGSVAASTVVIEPASGTAEDDAAS